MSSNPGATFLQDVDVVNARVGAERNSLNTEVVYYVNDLDAAPPEWRVGDVRSLATTSAVTNGSITLRVAVGSRQFVTDYLLSMADVIRAMHERVQLCQHPQTEFALLRESLGVSRINHILRVHGHTILEEQKVAAVHDKIGQRSLERLFPGLTEDSMTQATLSAGQSGIGFKRARDIAAPAHLGGLIAAKPCIQAMIRDAVWAGHLPEHLLETRLTAVIETATSTHLSALDDEDQATAKLYVQKAAQAGDEAWRTDRASQTRPSHPLNTQALPPKMKTAKTWTPKSRLSAPQLQAQLSRLTDRSRLSRLKDTLLSKVDWQQVTRIEDLCHAQVSHKWLYHLDACAGSVLTPHDCFANVQKRLGNSVWVGGGQCRCCGPFLDPQLEHAEICSNAEATRGHHACVHSAVCGMKLADPGITTEPWELTASRSRPADIFTTTVVLGRSAALDVCVASSVDSARGRHCLQSERAVPVCGIPSSQVETRNPNRSLAPEGSCGSRSSPESFSASSVALSQASLTELCTTGDMSPLSTAGLATTTSTTQRLTQPYQTTMTLCPKRGTRVNLCSYQVSHCPVCPPVRVGVLSAMALPRNEQGPQRLRSVPLFENLHFENSFEDNGVSGQQVLDLLASEDDVFQRCLSTALHRSNRGKCAHFLRDLAATLLSATAGFDSQVVVRS